ncbi:MAG: VOC family protein [Gammaproteobacteria bacterium]|nr:VOC family protein [Gammaproteobacteria bacterium]
MHQSKLSAIVIDCLDEHFEACLAFWAAAFGAPAPRRPRKGQRYVELQMHPGGLNILLQRVERDPGVHLDFESDSVQREADRMEAIGARRKYGRKTRTWWVMEDPSGNAFCVIRKQHPGPLEGATPWPDDKEAV